MDEKVIANSDSASQDVEVAGSIYIDTVAEKSYRKWSCDMYWINYVLTPSSQSGNSISFSFRSCH
jgi:hypothetical protein